MAKAYYTINAIKDNLAKIGLDLDEVMENPLAAKARLLENTGTLSARRVIIQKLEEGATMTDMLLALQQAFPERRDINLVSAIASYMQAIPKETGRPIEEERTSTGTVYRFAKGH